jgi:hypothetical protein
MKIQVFWHVNAISAAIFIFRVKQFTLLGVFDREEGGTTLLRNVCN